METNFVLDTIQRSNRNLMLLSFGGVLLLAAVAVLSFTYLYNFAFGPFLTPPEQVTAIENIGGQREQFVTVAGEEVIETGYQYVSTSGSGNETVEANYLALLVGDRFLLVKTGSSYDTNVVEYTGALVNMPDDVRREVINDIEAEVPEVKGAFLPVMLDTGNYRTNGFIGLGVGALVFLGCCYGLIQSNRRSSDPRKHPIMRKLERFGDAEMIAEQIHSEMSMAEKIPGGLQITRSWLLQSGSGSLNATRLQDVVWAYKKVTQHRANGIPTGKSFAALIHDRYGVCITVTGREGVVNQILEMLGNRAPGIALGYDKKLNDFYNTDRAGFAAAVDQRRRAV